MAPISGSQKVALLNNCGLKVDEDGVVTDWQDSPARHPRPVGQNEGVRAARHAFSAQDDEILRLWCTAANAEGLTGNRVFERLEATRPAHTWQAYQNRWRKSLRALPTPDLGTDRPFPGLGHVPGTEEQQSTEPPDIHNEAINVEREEEDPAYTYSDQRIEIDRVLFQRLGVEDKEELMSLLRRPWLGQIYQDLVLSNESSALTLHQLLPDTTSLGSRSQHQWKLDHAGLYLSSERPPLSRYTAKMPDTKSWTEDDFDLRFIVQAVNQGSAKGEIWYDQRKMYGWQPLAERALWLLLWFKWLQKSTSGQGREMQRLQEKRELWLAFMQQARAEHELAEEMTGERPMPRTQTLDQNLFLISDEARKLYHRNRNVRLASWGVGSDHSSSCVLVPAIWTSTAPEAVAEDPNSWPTGEGSMQRLTLSIGGFTLPWGRAAAWFEVWPRTTTELQHFLPPSMLRKENSLMHGSHRCHHGICVVPSHLLYEDGSINLSRCACATSAVALRSYGAKIPKHCNRHDPPCLLQLAALTTYECLAIQVNIMRLAKDLPARPPLPRPPHHPGTYTTFRQGSSPSLDFPDVGIEIENIVRLPGDTDDSANHRFKWNCSFCSYVRTFQKITTYWAHLRANHQGISTNDILAQVTASAQANQAWAQERFYNYARDNPTTWQKVQQAQAPDFSWEVFAGWRLSREPMYTGRSKEMWYNKEV